MDEETTAQLRGLLESVSGSESASFSFFQSRRLRRALRSTRIWTLVLLVLGLGVVGLLLAAGVTEFLQPIERRPAFIWIVPVVFSLLLLTPLYFLGAYIFRLHGFLRKESPERFLRMLISQRWLLTVLGIYAGIITIFLGLLLIFMVGAMLMLVGRVDALSR